MAKSRGGRPVGNRTNQDGEENFAVVQDFV